MIVGEPETIPFNFQYDLGVQYQVGRIVFDNPEQYAQYARNVIDVETGRAAMTRRAAFFSVTHPDDYATDLALKQLTIPVCESLQRQLPGWQYDQIVGALATKDALRATLSEKERASFLFVVAHGLMNNPAEPQHTMRQGTVLCADWPGRGPIIDDHLFAAADVDPSWDLRGLVVWLFAKCGVGTPDMSDFTRGRTGTSEPEARRSSISQLAKRLLGRRDGALAVIGHVDTTWSTSFMWPRVGPQTDTARRCGASNVALSRTGSEPGNGGWNGSCDDPGAREPEDSCRGFAGLRRSPPRAG